MGIALASVFFGLVGVHGDKDIFILTGLVATFLGSILLAYFMWDQDMDLILQNSPFGVNTEVSLWRVLGSGTTNDTFATLFVCLTVFCLYGIHCQFEKYREKGFWSDDDSESDKVDDIKAVKREKASPKTVASIEDNPTTIPNRTDMKMLKLRKRK